MPKKAGNVPGGWGQFNSSEKSGQSARPSHCLDASSRHVNPSVHWKPWQVAGVVGGSVCLCFLGGSASSQQFIHPCMHAIFPGVFYFILLIKGGVNWFNIFQDKTRTRQATDKTRDEQTISTQDERQCECLFEHKKGEAAQRIRNSALLFFFVVYVVKGKQNKARTV